jgi:hypothetical protein
VTSDGIGRRVDCRVVMLVVAVGLILLLIAIAA